MNNDLISVIIPVYNVDNYLHKCINSVIDQTYKNIEIILVDDGSTDSSGKICDEYAEKYNNVNAFHKKNGGLSSARNYGIDNCSGSYITFVDSDDYISKSFISIMYDAVINNSADLIISRLYDFYENDVVIEDDVDLNIEEKIDSEEALKQMLLQDGIDVNATAKLYSRNIFKDIRFPEGALYEDIQIIDKVMENALSIVKISYRGYYYLQRNNSIMYGKMSRKRLILVDKTKQLIEYAACHYPNIVSAAIRRYVYCNFHLLGRSILDSRYIDISIDLRKNILKYKSYIYRSCHFSFKERLATTILLMGLKCYRFFWKGYCALSNKKIDIN